jgi:pheromone shutdown protein TraB
MPTMPTMPAASPGPDAAAAPADGSSLPASVTTIEHQGVTYHIIGTAHVSAQSVDEVRSVIRRLAPDVVAVELCKPRYEALSQERAFRDLNIFKVIREGRTLYLLAHMALASYQRRMGAALGVKPGAELLAAVEAGKAAGARVELIDREINLTLKRTWANIGFWKRSMLLSSLVVGEEEDKNGQPVTAESIEQLKDQKALSSMLDELAKALPEVKGPLIDERDRYMASKMVDVAHERSPLAVTEAAQERAASVGAPRRVVAVVGAAHVPGMRATFGQPVDRKALETLPPPSLVWTALKWLIPALFLAGLLWGWQASSHRIDDVTRAGRDGHTLFELMMAWIAPTSIAAGGLTLLAGGSILTVLAAVLVAPIAAVHPLLGTAMVTGLVEAWRRKPSVGDCEALADDIQTLRGFWKNPVTRTLLIAVASGLGTAGGFWIGVGFVVKMLA